MKTIFRTALGALLFTATLAAWQTSIKLPTSGTIRENFVRLDRGNTAYIAYVEDYKVKLAKYDGARITLLGQVSDGLRQGYTPFIRFDQDNTMHIIWGEAVTLADADNSVMYRTYSTAGGFSPITRLATLTIPKNHVKGPHHAKIEQLRFALDPAKNLYVSLYEAPALRCRFFAKYGDEVIIEDWPDPDHVRTQTPDIVVDDTHVHLVWAQFLYSKDGSYTMYYTRRPIGKAAIGTWELPIVDVKNGQELTINVHRPRIVLDEHKTPYVLYMQDRDATTGATRNMFLRYWTGASFDGKTHLTPNLTRNYNNLNIELANSRNILVLAHGGFSTYYNWMVNGTWTGLGIVDSIPDNMDMECVAMSSDGSLAVVTYSPILSDGGVFFSELWVTSNRAWTANEPPIPVFTASQSDIFWQDRVTFSAASSTDPDGAIADYRWEIDGTTYQGREVTHAFARHGEVSVKLTVTDNHGLSTSTARTLTVKALFNALSTAVKTRFRTILYDKDGYLVTWSANPKNPAAGYQITGYKIYRRVAGVGEYAPLPESTIGGVNRYFDLSIEAGKNYEYVVVALDALGHQSPFDHN